jgi:hypothetical protein
MQKTISGGSGPRSVAAVGVSAASWPVGALVGVDPGRGLHYGGQTGRFSTPSRGLTRPKCGWSMGADFHKELGI